MKTIRCMPPVCHVLRVKLALVFLLTLAVPGLVIGQDHVEMMGKRSGIWYGGQYFGFDPGRVRPGGDESDQGFDEQSEASEEFDPSQQAELPCDDLGMCRDLGPECGVGRLWARGEFLWWWKKGMDLPALATTGPNNGILPQATVLFGESAVNDGALPGGRFTLGIWLDDCDCHSIEASFLMLGRASAGFSGSAADFPVLARPFTNVDPADLGADARLIASPNDAAGSLTILATTQFYSFDLLWRRNLSRTDCGTTDLLIGYRRSELSDRVRIDETTTALAGDFDGTNVVLFDQFSTRNVFNGGQIGLAFERRLNDCWTYDFAAKAAIGQVQSAIGIAGQTRTNPAGGTSTFTSGGLLAQPTNIGNFSQSQFTAMGEFNVNLRRRLRCGWSANVGYSLIVWGDVLRAGDQIDTNVNTSQIPPGTLTGDPHPLVPFSSASFWAHGLQLGVERAF